MLFLFHILLFTILSSCVPVAVQNDATIRFTNLRYDFDSVNYKNAIEYSFQFVNAGNSILIVNDVKISCICTVPEWPHEPNRPSKRAFVKINMMRLHRYFLQ
jgi:Protein of unknown function (DUF1573).